MLRICIYLLFIFGLCGAASFTTTHGKLKVSDGKILDENNNEVVLRGMSLFWEQWDEGGYYYTSDVVNSLANNWNVSLVRAALTISRGVQKAKDMMDWAKNAGVYVIIDNHSHSAHNETSKVQDFFKDVSAYVKDKGYTHVIYEIYNEPKDATWAQIKSFSQSVISTIRSNDPDGLIIVGTPSMSSNISAAKNDPLSVTYNKNVLYALHFYAGEMGHGLYREPLKDAYCNNFPIFVSEWGTSPASGDGTISTSSSNTWISLLEAAKVSYANWSITDKNESSAALKKNGGSRGSITRDADLTESGKYVKNLFRLNTGATLANVGLTQTTINCSSTQPSGPTGRIQLGYANSLVDFASKSGADSASVQPSGWALANTSANFTSSYTLIDIPKPGDYLINFDLASTAGGTVSWSGAGISSGQAEITNTGSLSTYKFSTFKTISIREAPETLLLLSFQTPSANSLRARYVQVREASSEDSLEYNISPVSIKKFINNNSWNYDAVSNVFIFETSEGSLAIYNLRGERKAIFAVAGRISLKNTLSAGTYLAVYKRGGLTYHKTIYLK